MVTARPLRILCLDGGGVRGLSSLIILKNIMKQLTSQGSPEPLPCDVFDMICGTSTGGLIALMLGRLRMSIDRAIDCYLSLSRLVFSNEHWFSRLRRVAHYDSSMLEMWIKQIVDERLHERDAPLQDPSPRICHTFVVAFTPWRAGASPTPKLLRSYPSTWDLDVKCKIWEAARATTAVMPFFDPVMIGGSPFIDVGFSAANNPSVIALREAFHIFPGRQIACFLSLGTGIPTAVTTDGRMSRIAEAYVRLAMSCELEHEEMTDIFRKYHPGIEHYPYFRFSVDRRLCPIPFDEWRRLEEINAITYGYMRAKEQLVRLEDCTETFGPVDEELEGKIEIPNPDLIKRLGKLRDSHQSPQCEGEHKNRVFLKLLGCHRPSNSDIDSQEEEVVSQYKNSMNSDHPVCHATRGTNVSRRRQSETE